MADGKRYFWLKLHDDFFDSKRIKKLRKMAGGDTYTIIYLKMQLLAMKSDGVLTFTGLEDNAADELALDLDEEPDNVKVTLSYLLHCGLAETDDEINFFFPYAISNTGSETAAAQRVRDHRARQMALHCNTDVTPMKQICNGEIEKEKRDRDRDRDRDISFDSFWSAYPRKVGKGDARKAFSKVKVSVDVLIAAIERQKASKQWTKDDGRYIPNPATWLNQERWEDDLGGTKSGDDNSWMNDYL